MALTLRDSHSYETQIIDAVRSVNRALGGTYGTSSAIYKNEFNQYEVQLIDAIKGIGRTLSSGNVSLGGGGGGNADLSGYVTKKEFQSLSARVTTLENESFFRLVDGNITLKEDYDNLWVPGWLAAGGLGEDGGGGGGGISGVSYAINTSEYDSSWVKIGTLAVTGQSTSSYDLYAPPGGGGGSTVSWGTVYSDHTVDLTVNGVTKNICLDGYSSGGGGGASSLSELSDVSISSPQNGQVLIYSSGYWVNGASPGGGGGTVTSVGMTVPTGLTVSGSPITTSGTLAVGLANGYVIPTQSTLDGFVTLTTTQTITGAKTFSSNPVTIDSTSGLSVHQSSYIDIGPLRMKYDSSAKALRITKASNGDATLYGLYADGFVAAGGTN
jgi:hypothetical protein